MRWPFSKEKEEQAVSPSTPELSRFSVETPKGPVVAFTIPALEKQARGLLAAAAEQQHELRDRYKIQFGWMLMNIAQRGSEFVVQEPNFAGNPYETYRDDVTATLVVLVNQLRLAQQVHAERDVPGFRDAIFCHKSCVDMAAHKIPRVNVYARRFEKTGSNDSGWRIGPADQDFNKAQEDGPEEFQELLVWHLLNFRYELLQALALPAGYMAVFRGDKLRAVIDATGEAVLANE